MRADGKNTKQVATSLKLSELSGVTVPAHTGANVTLFKCADPKEEHAVLVKSLFTEILTGEKEVKQIMQGISEHTEALWSANREAMQERNDLDAVKQNIRDYADSLMSLTKAKDVSEILGMAIDDEKKDQIQDMLDDPLNGDTLEERIKTVRSKLKKSGESDMTEQEIALLKSQLAEAVALGSMNDVQKAHYQTITDETEKSAFAKMSASDRDATVEILKQADETYETASGTTLKKSAVGAEVFAMLKSQDEELVKMRNDNLTTQFVKAAQSDANKHLPGEDLAKAAALRAIDGLPAEVKKTVTEMLSAGNAALGQEFTVKASAHTVTKVGEDKLDSLAKAHAAEHSVPYAKAYEAVMSTPEGQAIYEELK